MVIHRVIVFDPVKLAMLVVKIPSMLLSLVLAFKIKRMSGYILNTLFFIAYVGWATFIGTDALLYVIAPWNVASYTIANIMRDVGITMIGLVPLCFVQAGFVIKEGEEVAFQMKRTRFIITILVNFAITTGILLNDRILIVRGGAIVDPATLPPAPPPPHFNVSWDNLFFFLGINETTISGFIAFVMYLSFVAWYAFSVVLIFIQQRQLTGLQRARNIRIIIGILMIPGGILYFVLLPFLIQALPVLRDFQFFFNVIGQGIWASSPVFVYLGLVVKPAAEGKRETVTVSA